MSPESQNPSAPPPRPFRANATVAVLLSGVAGALNAGGFLVVGTYTSHVTGNWSRMADELALGHLWTAFRFFSFVACFIAGATTSTLLIEHDLKLAHRIRYLKPLILEIALLAAFVFIGRTVRSPDDDPFAAITTWILCFTMGLQNAMVTKLSGAVVRTTHMTGVSTDLGIELARLTLLLRDRWREWGQARASAPEGGPAFRQFARDTRAQLRREVLKAALLVTILLSFAAGAIAGAFSFLHWGFVGAAPIAVVLAFLVALELFLVQVLKVEEGVLTGPASRRYDRKTLLQRVGAPPPALGSTAPPPPPPSNDPDAGQRQSA